MTDLTPDHPAVDAAERAATRWMEDRELETDLDGTAYMLTAALPHLTADDLRDTPAGLELIREGIAAARNLEWMRPRMTPGGRIFNPAIPGDEMRAVREDALAREALQNMRESEQGRALMAEGWEEGALHQARGSAETRRVLASALPNPYRTAS